MNDTAWRSWSVIVAFGLSIPVSRPGRARPALEKRGSVAETAYDQRISASVGPGKNIFRLPSCQRTTYGGLPRSLHTSVIITS